MFSNYSPVSGVPIFLNYLKDLFQNDYLNFSTRITQFIIISSVFGKHTPHNQHSSYSQTKLEMHQKIINLYLGCFQTYLIVYYHHVVLVHRLPQNGMKLPNLEQQTSNPPEEEAQATYTFATKMTWKVKILCIIHFTGK